MAVLYAIFKSQAQRRRKGKAKKRNGELPEEAKRAKTNMLHFGGHDFMVIKDDAISKANGSYLLRMSRRWPRVLAGGDLKSGD